MQTITATPPPVLSYSQCLLNTLRREGWSLSHYTFNDADGSVRYFVRARHDSEELLCSAPTLALAVQVIYNEFMQM
jgi:hypothetical protein